MAKGFYRLAGALNMFGYTQDFVFPVFEKDGLYYLIDSKNNRIKDFKLMTNQTQLARFYNIGIENSTYTNAKRLYIIGDKVPHIFQIDNNKFLIFDLKSCFDFIKHFDTNDEILKLMFKNFIDDNTKYLTEENKVLKKQKKY